jgi:hypothetical protein
MAERLTAGETALAPHTTPPSGGSSRLERWQLSRLAVSSAEGAAALHAAGSTERDAGIR